MSDEQLKPCPKCKSERLERHSEDNLGCVRCKSCGFSGEFSVYGQVADGLWNRIDRNTRTLDKEDK